MHCLEAIGICARRLVSKIHNDDKISAENLRDGGGSTKVGFVVSTLMVWSVGRRSGWPHWNPERRFIRLAVSVGRRLSQDRRRSGRLYRDFLCGEHRVIIFDVGRSCKKNIPVRREPAPTRPVTTCHFPELAVLERYLPRLTGKRGRLRVPRGQMTRDSPRRFHPHSLCMHSLRQGKETNELAKLWREVQEPREPLLGT